MVTKEQRKERLEKGLCGSCGLRPLIEGITLCQKCLDHKREYTRRTREKKKANKVCKQCSNPATHGNYCEVCVTKQIAYKRKQRNKRKEAGLCVDCENPIVPGHIYCEDHLAKKRKYKQRQTELRKQKAKSYVQFDKVFDVERRVIKNFLGKRYGNLEVIDYSHYIEESRLHYWITKCDCGELRLISQNHLTKAKSCGCQNPKNKYKVYDKLYLKNRHLAKNYIGEIYGNYMVIEFSHQDDKTNSNNYWECKCLDCGRETLINQKLLINNRFANCSCNDERNFLSLRELLYDLIKRAKEKTLSMELQEVEVLDQESGKMIKIKEDLTGRWFGSLKVLEFSYKNKRGYKWLCECKCGSIDIYSQSMLQHGNLFHCGCKSK